jgi:hypothetical protein
MSEPEAVLGGEEELVDAGAGDRCAVEVCTGVEVGGTCEEGGWATAGALGVSTSTSTEEKSVDEGRGRESAVDESESSFEEEDGG